jgi:predicted P-loop ATPase
MLVLDGEQGIGKSTLFKELAGEEYFSDSLQLCDMDSKAAAEKIQGFWICEIAELAGMKKADIEKVKSFLSSSDDKFRPSYGKNVESHPRQGIMVASVNGDRGYLRDITGNRRFWVVKLHQTEQVKTFEFSEADRDQIWAEAKHYYHGGEKLYLEGALVEEAAEVQKDAMEEDERQGMVEVYLETLLPENWSDMDLYARRAYLHNTDDPTITKGTVKRETVSNVEIWCECYCKSLSDLKPSDSYAIMALMETVDGWKRSKTRKRMPIYGQQRVYVRD